MGEGFVESLERVFLERAADPRIMNLFEVVAPLFLDAQVDTVAGQKVPVLTPLLHVDIPRYFAGCSVGKHPGLPVPVAAQEAHAHLYNIRPQRSEDRLFHDRELLDDVVDVDVSLFDSERVF
jgi:hypothetical protein